MAQVDRLAELYSFYRRPTPWKLRNVRGVIFRDAERLEVAREIQRNKKLKPNRCGNFWRYKQLYIIMQINAMFGSKTKKQRKKLKRYEAFAETV